MPHCPFHTPFLQSGRLSSDSRHRQAGRQAMALASWVGPALEDRRGGCCSADAPSVPAASSGRGPCRWPLRLGLGPMLTWERWEGLDRAPALLISREVGGQLQCEVQLHCPSYHCRAWSWCPRAQLGKRRTGREVDCPVSKQQADLRFDSRPDWLHVVLLNSRRTELTKRQSHL